MRIFLLALLLVSSFLQAAPKNIILMIGDGMGPAYLKAYRLYKDNPETETIETTVFDQLLVGSLATDPDARSGSITDSAASATAYATGVKTFNGGISVDKNKKPLATVLHRSKIVGKSTGLIATSQIVHATPAAFAANNVSRENHSEIADHFFDLQFKDRPYVDVFLGGGWKDFKREDRDLISEFQAIDYAIVRDKTQLAAHQLSKTSARGLIGLFAPVSMQQHWSRDKEEPSLAEMTGAALAELSKNNKGFFLMVESSQIDWAGHGNDILGVMSEMEGFEQAIVQVMKYIDAHSETLLIVTADHETGGLSIGVNQKYTWGNDLLRRAKLTGKAIVNAGTKNYANIASIIESQLSISLNSEDKQSLEEAIENGNKQIVYYAIVNIINRHSHTGWTSYGHTGVDVPLMAYGSQRNDFVGHHDNTFIGKQIFRYLEPSTTE